MFLGARAGSIITSVLSLAPALPQTVTNGLVPNSRRLIYLYVCSRRLT